MNELRHIRVEMPYRDHGAAIETWLIEMAPDGGVLRQVGVDAEGEVEYRCGPEEFGVWNDEIFFWDSALPPEAQWTVLVREYGGRLIDARAFEAKWEEASSPLGVWANEPSMLKRIRSWIHRNPE